MLFHTRASRKGFTLIELLVVIAIIGIISAVVLAALEQSRIKGRDAHRKSQLQEILKALELYYSDGDTYPTIPGNEDYLSDIDASFYGPGTYLSRLPDESDARYYYCVSTDGKSIALSINTEDDKGGSEWCSITRGSSPYGCTAWITANASDSCTTRF